MSRDLSDSKPNTSYLKIGDAARKLGVSIDTLRRWEKAGKIKVVRTPGGTRLYSTTLLQAVIPKPPKVPQQPIKPYQTTPKTTEELLRNLDPDFRSKFKRPDSLNKNRGAPFPPSRNASHSEAGGPAIALPANQTRTEALRRFFGKFAQVYTILVLFFSITLIITGAIVIGYLNNPKATARFFASTSKDTTPGEQSEAITPGEIASAVLAPFNTLAKKTIETTSPRLAEQLELGARSLELGAESQRSTKLSDNLVQKPSSLNLVPSSSAVLAVTTAKDYLQINAATQIEGDLSVRDTINGLTLEASPSAVFISAGSSATLTATNNSVINQNVSTTASPTFAALNLSSTLNQLIFQSGGPTGTLTWTPTVARIITLPDATTTLVGTDTTQTLTNKSISGSSNTLTSIANSSLVNSKVTISAGTNLEGGGDVSLGSSVTISLKSSPEFSGQVKLSDGTAAAPGLTFTDDTDTGLYRLGANKIGLITAGSATSGITIDANGNLGVATISPSYKLDVTGTGRFTGAVTLDSSLGVTGATTLSSTLGVTGATTLSSTLGVTGAATFSNDLTVDTNTFFVNSTTNRVGIGTTSPVFPLHVWGDNTNSATFLNGNVGIGTTAPNVSLAVSGNAVIGSNENRSGANLEIVGSGTTVVARNSSSTNYASYSIFNDQNSSSRSLQLAYSGSAYASSLLTSGTLGESAAITTSGAYPLSLGVSNTARLTIDSAGNIGIGTTSPTAALYINGRTKVTNNILAENGYSVDIGSGSQRFATGYFDTVDALNLAGTVTGGATSNASWTINSDNATADAEDMFLAFERGTTTPNASMAWNSTTNPNPGYFEFNSGLRILGTITSLNGIELSGLTYDLITPSGENLSIFPGGAGSSTGNVGIGTTGPIAYVNIAGRGTTTGLAFLTQNSSRSNFGLAVLDNGNVGIGTTNPAVKLESSATTEQLRLTYDSSNYASFTVGSTGILNIVPTGTVGTVGIGISSTVGKLNVSTSGSTNGLYLQNTSASSYLAFEGGDTTVKPQIGTLAGEFKILTNSIQRMTVTTGGNVGIGTASPGSKLGVAGNVGIGVSYSTYASPINGLIVEGNVGIGTTSPSQLLQVNYSSANPFVVTSGGNVGIGFTTPTSLLQVQDSGGLSSWKTNSSNAPVALGNAASTAVTANGYVYLLGGAGVSYSSAVYYAKINPDGSLGSFTATTSMPENHSKANSAVVNGYLYVMMGTTNGSSTSKVIAAKINNDGTLGNWVQVLADSGSFSSHMTFISNGYLYSLRNDSSYYWKINANGTISGQLSTTAFPVDQTTTHSQPIVANGYVYVIFATSVYYSKIAVDGSLGPWSTTTTFPVSRTRHTLAVLNGYLYAIGGSSDSSNGVTTVYYAKLNSNGTVEAWNTTSALPGASLNHATTVANGYVYAMAGGTDTGHQTTTVYYASAARVSMAANLDLLGLTAHSLSNSSPGLEGGSIFAGSIYSKDSLEVGGNANFWNGAGFFGPVSIGVGTTNNASPVFNIASSASSKPLGVLFTVASSGNVGIGATSPTYLLDVAGISHLRGSAGGTGLTVTAAGSVGIGITSPGGALHVKNSNASLVGLVIDQQTSGSAGSPLKLRDINGNTLVDFAYGTSGGSAVAGSIAMTAVNTGSAASDLYFKNSGNTLASPGVSSNGDDLGRIIFQGHNGSGFTEAVKILAEVDGALTGGGASDMPGRLTFWTTPDGSGTSLERLRIDNQGNIGIGTASPVAQLDLRNTNTSTGLHMYVGSSAGQFGILDNGNVGIGFTAPSQRLDIRDGELVLSDSDVDHGMTTLTATNNFAQLQVAHATNGGLRLRGLTDADAVALTLVGVIGSTNPADGTAAIQLAGVKWNGSTSLAALGAAETAVGIDSNADGTNEVVVIGSGNVGIGFTSPSQLLHVMGDGTGSRGIIIENNTTNTNLTSLISLRTPGSTNWGIFKWGGTTDNGGNLWFSKDGGVTSTLTLTSGSNVGIGWTAPTAALHVLQTGSADAFRVDDVANDTTPFVIDAGGNVGIGTTTANYNLTVVGTTNITGNATFGSQILAPNGSQSAPSYSFSNSTNVGAWTQNNALMLTTNGSQTSGMTITSSGNVGIGLTYPSQLFQINSTGGTAFVVTSGGNVGIGGNPTSSGVDSIRPAAKLDVTGNIRLGHEASNFIDFYEAAGTARIQASGNPQILTIGRDDTPVLTIGTNSTLLGRVGINTTLPTTSFQVNETGSNPFVVQSGGNVGIGTTNPVASLYVNGNAMIGYTSGSPASLANGLAVSGNVGIGTTGPTYALDVAGISHLRGSAGGTGLTVTAAGSVGIGITAPAAKFQITNAATTSDLDAFRINQQDLTSSTIGTIQADGNTLFNFQFGTSGGNPVGALLTLAGINTGGAASNLYFNDSGGSFASPSVSSNGDDLGRIIFQGHNGSGFTEAVKILAEVDGAVTGGGASDMPGRLTFWTTPDGSGTSLERMRIDNQGNIGIGWTSPTALLHVLQTGSADAFRVDDVANDTSPFVIDAGGNVGIGGNVGANVFNASSLQSAFGGFGSYQNLLVQSEDFSTTWTANGVNVTANNTTAPDGALTADKLVEDSANSNRDRRQSVTLVANTNYTFSVYLKAAGREWIYLKIDNAGSIIRLFNLTTGTIGSASSGSSTARITPVGNGWYRASISFDSGSLTGTLVAIGLADSDTINDSYQGDGSSGVYAWGAQVEQGSAAGPYVKTETTAQRTPGSGLVVSSTGASLFTSKVQIGVGTTAASSFFINSSGASTGWTLATRDSGGTYRNVMLDNGNLGIGTTGPTYALDVAGISHLRGSAGGTGLTVTAAGSVGIGITAPAAALQINNTNANIDGIRIRQTTASSGENTPFALYDSSGNNLYKIQYGTAGGEAVQASSTNFSFGTHTQVGIWASQSFSRARGTPTSPTVVTNGDTAGAIYFNAYDGSNYRNAARIVGEVDGAVTGGGAADMPGRLTFWTTPDGSATLAERLRIDNQGNIGIGTSFPSQRFQVNTNASNPFVVTSGGNVGIGTTIPVGLLHLSSDTATDLRLHEYTTGTSPSILTFVKGRGTAANPTTVASGDYLGSIEFYGYDGTSNEYAGDIVSQATGFSSNQITSALLFRTSNNGTVNEAMRITGSGNVGIGFTSPLHKLEAGDATSTNLIPDYFNSISIGASTAAMGAVTDNKAVYLLSNSTTSLLDAYDYNTSTALDVTIAQNGGKVKVNLAQTTSNFAVCHINNATGVDELTDCNGSATDLAENYGTSDPTIEAADLVVSDGQATQLLDKHEGKLTSKAFVAKSSTPYQQNIIGIVSTNPNQVYGDDIFDPSENPRPVSLTGRVPIKVSTENGPIEAGDFLTSSSVPGVAMKATRPGQVVGKALEEFDPSTGSGQAGSDCGIGYKCGKILMFVNVSFADPGNFLASLTLDNEGNFIIPKIKTASLQIDPTIVDNLQITSNSSQLTSSSAGLGSDATASATLSSSDLAPSSNTLSYDLTGKIASLEARIAALELGADGSTSKDLELSNTTATSSSNLVPSSTNLVLATDSAILAASESSTSAIPVATGSAFTNSDNSEFLIPNSELGLTPPDTLLASGSAILSNLIVKSEATFSGMLHSYNSEISNSFKVFGDTTLGKTNIAGSLTVDGTLTIDQGSQINVLGLSNLPGSGILYLQKSAQAQGLDILSGKVTIDKTGLLTTQTISATQYRAVVGKSTGSGKISAGAKSAEIPSSVVETTSRILVTPTVETNMPLSVISKKAGQSFTVSIPTPAFQDIPFDWFIVNEASP